MERERIPGNEQVKFNVRMRQACHSVKSLYMHYYPINSYKSYHLCVCVCLCAFEDVYDQILFYMTPSVCVERG